MAQGLEVEYWFRADITLKLLSDGTTTKTLSVVNRPCFSATTLRWPLLDSFSNISYTLGYSGLPVISSGSITIKDGPGSFGENRRVSDLFDRYTATDQQVDLYADTTTAGDSNPAWTSCFHWTGKCRAAGRANDLLTLQLDAFQIDQKIMTALITTTDFPNAPQSSIGKVVPIIIGDHDSADTI